MPNAQTPQQSLISNQTGVKSGLQTARSGSAISAADQGVHICGRASSIIGSAQEQTNELSIGGQR